MELLSHRANEREARQHAACDIPALRTRVAVADGPNWFEGMVIGHRTEDDRGVPIPCIQVAYDAGFQRWHNLLTSQVRPALADDAECICEIQHGWQRIETRCCISHAALIDPARGDTCTHESRCNYGKLRNYAARKQACPVAGCNAPIPRVHSVVRDDSMRKALQHQRDIHTAGLAGTIWWSAQLGKCAVESPVQLPPSQVPITKVVRKRLSESKPEMGTVVAMEEAVVKAESDSSDYEVEVEVDEVLIEKTGRAIEPRTCPSAAAADGRPQNACRRPRRKSKKHAPYHPPRPTLPDWKPAAGARCRARYQASRLGTAGTRWYDGCIVVAHTNGSCDVLYDDGDTELSVEARFLKAPLCAVSEQQAEREVALAAEEQQAPEASSLPRVRLILRVPFPGGEENLKQAALDEAKAEGLNLARNISGYRGVYYQPHVSQTKPYMARTLTTWLGQFALPEQAALSYARQVRRDATGTARPANENEARAPPPPYRMNYALYYGEDSD